MFLPLEFDVNTLEAVPDYTAPITSQEGAIILNTEVLAEAGLDKPASLQDLADPKYAGQVAVTDIQSSSTAWLMIQALVSALSLIHILWTGRIARSRPCGFSVACFGMTAGN